MTATEPSRTAPSESGGGASYALSAFVLWGAFPIYFKAVTEVPALELIGHRTMWSTFFVGLVIVALGRRHLVMETFRNRRLLLTLSLTALILAFNWMIFIWAMNSGQVLQSSLGYYINPLVSVALGFVVLGERLNRRRWAAVALAATGVAIPILGLGQFPWVALSLAVSFGVYGLMRKTASVDAITGLLVETLLLCPFALAYIIYIEVTGIAVFGEVSLKLDILIIACGAVTALPLVLFTQAARRLPLATVGIFQYIAPSGHFLLAVFAYGEAFTSAHLATFALIWAALAVYTWDMLAARREKAGEVRRARGIGP